MKRHLLIVCKMAVLILATAARSQDFTLAVDLTNGIVSSKSLIQTHRWATNLVFWLSGANDSMTTPYSVGDASRSRITFNQTNSARRPAWTNANGDGYFTFSQSALYGESSSLNEVFTSGQFAVSAYITPSAITSPFAVIVGKYTDSSITPSGASRQFALVLNTNRLRFLVANTNGTLFAAWNSVPATTSGAPLLVGVTWNHADGGTNRAKLFFNGVQVSTYTPLADAGAAIQAGTAKLSVGGAVDAGGAQGYYFPGSIDDVRIFNTSSAIVHGECWSNRPGN